MGKVVERAAMGCQHPKVSKAKTANRKRRDKVSKQSRSWVEQLARFGNKLDPPDLHTQRLTFECPEVKRKTTGSRDRETVGISAPEEGRFSII